MRKILFGLALTMMLCVNAFAAVPHLINYQGRLTDTAGAPLTGSYAVTFRIYDAQTAGILLWEETQNGVVVDKGLFGVLLGSVTALNIAFDKPYFLEIKVGTEVMTPRQQITSAGYAIRAEKAEQYDGPGKVGTKTVDETGLSDGMRPYYDNASGKIKYNAPVTIGFGAWVIRSNDTVYQAATDGIVLANRNAIGSIYGYTDGSNPPTTERAFSTSGNGNANFTMPVRKNDYWKVTNTDRSVYWLSLGN